MANNPSISRISGKGSRLAFSLAPYPVRAGTHVRRDILALLEQWDELVKVHPKSINGHALLWTLKWDGKKQLNLNELHPLYIEVCRRRRLRLRPNGSLFMQRASGTSTRIFGASTSAGKAALKGRTGDPWIPVDRKRDKALTLPPNVGFTYQNITRCLNLSGKDAGNWEVPLLCKTTTSEDNSRHQMALVLRGTAPGDGQNKTGGYYERIIPFRPMTYRVFGSPKAAKRLEEIANRRITQIGTVQGILRRSTAIFACHGNSDKAKRLLSGAMRNDPLRRRIDELAGVSEETIDDRFFEHLQYEFEASETEQRSIGDEWLDGFVISRAEFALTLAHKSLPTPQNEFFRASASSSNLFHGSIRSTFPDLPRYQRKEHNDD